MVTDLEKRNMPEDHPLRRCDDCIAHSGVEARLDAHGKILTSFDDSLKSLSGWGIKILIGILLTLFSTGVTAAVAIYIAMQGRIDTIHSTPPPPPPGYYNHQATPAKPEPAILIETIYLDRMREVL